MPENSLAYVGLLYKRSRTVISKRFTRFTRWNYFSRESSGFVPLTAPFCCFVCCHLLFCLFFYMLSESRANAFLHWWANPEPTIFNSKFCQIFHKKSTLKSFKKPEAQNLTLSIPKPLQKIRLQRFSNSKCFVGGFGYADFRVVGFAV